VKLDDAKEKVKILYEEITKEGEVEELPANAVSNCSLSTHYYIAHHPTLVHTQPTSHPSLGNLFVC